MGHPPGGGDIARRVLPVLSFKRTRLQIAIRMLARGRRTACYPWHGPPWHAHVLNRVQFYKVGAVDLAGKLLFREVQRFRETWLWRETRRRSQSASTFSKVLVRYR